jgi:hypothetical protein
MDPVFPPLDVVEEALSRRGAATLVRSRDARARGGGSGGGGDKGGRLLLGDLPREVGDAPLEVTLLPLFSKVELVAIREVNFVKTILLVPVNVVETIGSTTTATSTKKILVAAARGKSPS